MKEVHAVTEYIQKLLLLEEKGKKVTEDDIGVVVPYKLQCKIIRRVCNRMNLKDITIGTPEAFQGQEKPIMIVTTVRSGGNLGFLNDPRVCNLCYVLDSITLIPEPNHFKMFFFRLISENKCYFNKSKVFIDYCRRSAYSKPKS